MASNTVRLTIITDFVCANCCITEHELLNAITYCRDTLNLPLSFELEHLPFRLINTASLSDNGPKIDKRTFMTQWIGKERFLKIESAIAKWGDEKGIPIKFHGVMSQSTRAHRLCQKAFRIGGPELQTPVLFALFKAYLEESKDIADNNVLADLAENVGMMTRGEALKFLESDELEKEIHEMCAAARSRGIAGVPMTIINGKWAITGSQSADVYIQIFKRLAAAICTSPSTPLHTPTMNTEIRT
ncbi:hypothetical protein AMATHDRAFT_55687 [Amanita thiersii Skay4041]|uniref:DSBA-like thioredoxin domain-containing protein n=1 Tax=Amanita thiersii Skay4041 TaxID=703135 RepID=A0A2A9NYW9_9AGAR|nr:hypothetical protein AMATHDRAFT_55687 [Amanita thiersii Skay4041]